MRVIVSGGGTGGHIYPAISIAKSILEKESDAEILYVGTEKGLESILVSEEGLDFMPIRVKGFRRKLSLDTLKTVFEVFKGMVDADKILRRFKPDIVVGTGGYVAGPILIMAAIRKIPTLIHEQNVLPGVTNRILARFVDRIALSFKEAVKYFNSPGKVIVTGNPVRREILKKNRETSMRVLGFEAEKPLVVVFGGSKGSFSLNRAMIEVISQLYRYNDFQLLHVTGNNHYSDFLKRLESRGVNLKGNTHIKVVQYLHKMPDALAAADLVLTSAGAITLAEITAVGIPSILVPKSYATDNHQEYNARAMEKNGAAVVVLERELDGQRLYMQLVELIKDKNTLKYMRKASHKMGKIDASDKIYRMVKELVEK